MHVAPWLIEPASTGVAAAIDDFSWPPCPSPFPPDVVRRVCKGDNGDSLEPVPDTVSRYRVYAHLGVPKLPPDLLLRSEVNARLMRAQSLLPQGLSFVVLDGWRSLAFQQELVSYYSTLMGSGLEEGYVADPGDTVVAAPHTTGGAIDLTVQYAGQPLALGTDFDAFDEKAELCYFERLPDDELDDSAALAKSLRRCMSDALSRAGFAQYPQEWWHWSYGDQWWAARYGHATSLYAEVG